VMHALVAVEERAQRRVDYRVQLQHVMERVSPRTKPARLLSRDKPLHRAGS
jgi:hypothetical protein